MYIIFPWYLKNDRKLKIYAFMSIIEKIICLGGIFIMNANKNLVFKSTVLAAALLLSSSIVFAQTHFSGFAGVAGNIGTEKDSDKVQLTTDSFFAGQLDLFGKVQLRAGATVHTANLISKDVFQAVPASFTLDEFSLTLRLPCCHVTRYLALFAGEYESIGSDLFLQRHFGILPVASRITETWLGLTDTVLYPFSGFGAAYVVRLKTPQAFGAYIYMNDRDDQSRINTDLRFGGVFPVVTVDFSFGFGFPILIGDSGGETAVSLNQRIEFHAGTTLVVGNVHTANLFLQVGVNKVLLNPAEGEKPLQLSDLYFLIEPRFKADFMSFHLSLFNLPERIMQDLFFVSNPLGCDLSIFAESIHAGIFNFTFGAHFIVTASGNSLDNFTDFTTNDLSFQFSPFVETPLFRGTLMSRFTIDFMQFEEMHKTIKFALGYKVQL